MTSVRLTVSSGGSKSSNSLYCASLALHWLSALHIALCWVPALYYSTTLTPTTRFFISRAPNMITRLDVELQPLHWLPVLHIDLYWLPTLAPTTRGFISRTTDWK